MMKDFFFFLQSFVIIKLNINIFLALALENLKIIKEICLPFTIIMIITDFFSTSRKKNEINYKTYFFWGEGGLKKKEACIN